VLVTNEVEFRATDDAETRVSIRLSKGAQDAVEEIKKLGGFSTTQEAIRRAIADERYLQRKRTEGWTILLRKGNEYIELVWPG
jgi:Arc/MetJ-type ribon-helix-helix transcriptional regulator